MALTIKIRGDATHLEKTMRGVQASVNGLSSGLGKAAMAGAGFAAALAGINTAEAVISKLGQAVKDASGKAAGMESLTLQFEVLTKSADKAQSLIASFREEATKSPLSVQDYADAGKTLMAFGVSADETLPILRMLGDVSMGNAERFSSLATAFAQTQAAGRLMGQEVLQFVNSGFNPLQEISRKTGRSMVDLKKAMEDGAISADMVTEAFRSATSNGGLFFGAIQKGATTLEGKFAKVRDSVDSLKIAFGSGMNEGLKNALDATNATLPQLEERFTQFGQIVGKTITDAVNGNYDIILQAGVLIGETLKEGFLMSISEAATQVFKPDPNAKGPLFFRGAEALGFNIPKIKSKTPPPRTPGQFVGDLKRITAAERKAFQETVSRRDIERQTEELQKTRMAVEELLRKGIKVTRESLAQEIYSR